MFRGDLGDFGLERVQRVADAVEYLKKALNPIDDGNGPAGLNTEALFENVES